MRIHAVPQWQGAVNPTARGLRAGCDALAGAAAHWLDAEPYRVDQSDETSVTVDGVASRDVLVTNLAAHREALRATAGPVLTIGGDCGVELAPVAAARATYGEELRLVWFDAHPDLNTPQTSPSGGFHGMVLRALLGEGDPDLTADPAVTPGNVALVGTRSYDDAEQEALDRGLAVVSADPAARVPADVPTYVHVDLDVLDPSAFAGLNYPEPGGASVAELVDLLDLLRGRRVVGAGITECVGSPADVQVLEPVVRVVGDLLTRSR